MLIQRYPLLYDVLRWIGVGYLLYLAWEGWQTERQVSPERTYLAVTAGPLFLRGFLSNVFNPKSILFFVSVLPTFVRTGPGAPSLPIQMAVFGSLYVGIATAEKWWGIVSRANLLHALATLAPTAQGPTPDDANIRQNLLAELERQKWAPIGLLNIIVQNGVVDLWGSITDEREREAIIVAAKIHLVSKRFVITCSLRNQSAVLL